MWRAKTNLLDFGLLSSNNPGATLPRFEEPPDADPHVRWCGEGRQQWRPLPDLCGILGERIHHELGSDGGHNCRCMR